jgi:hypothetical protein
VNILLFGIGSSTLKLDTDRSTVHEDITADNTEVLPGREDI